MQRDIARERFTAELWKEVFLLYRNVNQCHWKLPLFQDVEQALAERGVYAFADGKSSQLVIRSMGAMISIRFVPTLIHPTPLLAGHMRQMQQTFEQELGVVLRDA